MMNAFEELQEKAAVIRDEYRRMTTELRDAYAQAEVDDSYADADSLSDEYAPEFEAKLGQLLYLIYGEIQ